MFENASFLSYVGYENLRLIWTYLSDGKCKKIWILRVKFDTDNEVASESPRPLS